jgi:glycosyltransferase involved in cell wall biosynthesis
MNLAEFKSTYQKVPVKHFPNKVSDDSLVSVCVQTYQHAAFIKDCLDGILMQQTNFPFEILLGEDASKDGTREICIKYAKRHPDTIRLFLHRRENNIEVDDRPTGRFNLLYNLFSAKAKYIAICEGDDYWTDPNKLQKQVDLFEANPNFSLVVGGYEIVTDKKENIYFNGALANNSSPRGYIFSLEDTRKNWITQPLTSMFRREKIENIEINRYKYFRDVHLFYHLLKEGDGFYLTSILGVYRLHEGGMFSSLKIEEKKLINFYVYQELYEANLDEYCRYRYLIFAKILLSYYSWHKIGNRDISRFYLLKISFHIVENAREFFSVIKASLTVIDKIRTKLKLIFSN